MLSVSRESQSDKSGSIVMCETRILCSTLSSYRSGGRLQSRPTKSLSISPFNVLKEYNLWSEVESEPLHNLLFPGSDSYLVEYRDRTLTPLWLVGIIVLMVLRRLIIMVRRLLLSSRP